MEENLIIKAHRKIVMNRRVEKTSKVISEFVPQGVQTMLDVGAGTGEMAQAVKEFRPELTVTGIEVGIRAKSFIPITKYDGKHIPFADNSYDALMICDVLHHCDDPVATLRECARVTKRWVIIKDHVADRLLDNKILSFMDWVGNRAHGVGLVYNYLSSKKWKSAFEQSGLKLVKDTNKIDTFAMPFELIFGGPLHRVYLLEKTGQS